MRNRMRCLAGWTYALTVALAAPVLAGGGPENALLIIDPTSNESLYVGRYYQQARNIPDNRVIYMNPVAIDFEDFVDNQRLVVEGTLLNLGIVDYVDYIVMPPSSSFFVSASGFVSDGCFPVSRFSLSQTYGLTKIYNFILPGVSVMYGNEYYSNTDEAIAFDSEIGWSNGQPTPASSPAYYIGAMLGWTGSNGNTMEEILDLIDRSVAVDGTRPVGTSYFMETTDEARSGPRHDFYPAAAQSIVDLGGQAEHLLAVLPEGNDDVLGVMTGWASPDIVGADMTMLPGSFGDHLTSFAGTFDNGAQTKMSQWIKKGASGSYGTVEEPCNYSGKFPHARMHVFYYQGLSLGESVLRSLEFVPFQGLIYGDPLTRPFAYLPVVDPPDAPLEDVAGVLSFTPTASTDNPAAGIGSFDLVVDGRRRATIVAGETFVMDTTTFADGPHDLRVVAFEDSDIASQGRWTGTLVTNNRNQAVDLVADPLTGDLSTMFSFSANVAGGTVGEVRLVAGGRVVASSNSASASWDVMGAYLGPGSMNVVAEADFVDGGSAQSQRIALDVDFSNEPPGAPGESAPIAYGFTKILGRNSTTMVELPATDADGSNLTYTIVEQPEMATVEGDGPTRLLRADSFSEGTDMFTFSASDGSQTSAIATVHVVYGFRSGDFDADGDVDLRDAAELMNCWTAADPPTIPSDPCAAAFDWRPDADVDLSDWKFFRVVLEGPGM